jgi:hypothetical protein
MIGGTPIKEIEEPIDHYFSEEYIDEQFVVEPVEDLEGPKGNNGPDDSTLNEISSEEEHEQIEEQEEDIIFSPDFHDDVTYSPDLLTDDENNAIEETVDEESISETEETQEDGEFGGYKLGNVYKGKKNIKDYENSKDIPLDLLVSKGDPTRL